MTWVEAYDEVQADPNKGYVARNVDAPVVVKLPAHPAIGDVVRVNGGAAGGWSIAQNAAQVIHTGALGDLAGRSWSTNGTSGYWTAVASSANGRRLVAVDSDSMSLHTSSDGGATWKQSTQADAGQTFEAVASSADGLTLAVASNTGVIKVSTNAGSSWETTNSATRRWRDLALSADGKRIVAVVNDSGVVGAGGIHTWDSRSAQWTDRGVPGEWTSVASSADGMRLIASTGGASGRLFTSADGGQTWSSASRSPQGDWRDVASSTDGHRLAAVAASGSIVVSSDAGANWSPYALDGQFIWMSLAMSADGSKLAVVGRDTAVHLSADGGLTWRSAGDLRPRWSIAMSASGDRIVAPYGVTAGSPGAIQYSLATTTPGSAGGLAGEAFDAVELQYIGDGRYNLLSYAGRVVAR